MIKLSSLSNSVMFVNLMFPLVTCPEVTDKSLILKKDVRSNVTLFFTKLQQLNSRICNIVDIVNSTKPSDDDIFTNKMLDLVGETFQIQEKLHNLNFDELRLRRELNMTDDEIDKAKYLYFNTHQMLSIFIS